MRLDGVGGVAQKAVTRADAHHSSTIVPSRKSRTTGGEGGVRNLLTLDLFDLYNTRAHVLG